QEVARKKTVRLVALFVLAIVAIIAAVYGLAAGILYNMYLREGSKAAVERFMQREGHLVSEWTWWHPELLLYVVGGTLLIIGLGSAFKIAMLSGGGASIAQLLGGRLINPETDNAAERRLINIVEEMSIASGCPAPQVYVLDAEEGLNAFAAGFSQNDAVVAVTRGLLQRLSRDELQGVIAHEFSHILNGDMLLNIRLMGILHGILVIGILGMALVRSVFFTPYHYRSRRDRQGGGAAGIIVVGLALTVIGYVGVFFGRLIKAAVSRQREFLADASAVQFTRNADGIAGALKKIGGFEQHAVVESKAAEEASHMFFGDALPPRMLFGGMLATHPPLAERIRRIDRTFDGEFTEAWSDVVAAAGGAAAGFAGGAPAISPSTAAAPLRVRPGDVVAQVGSLSHDHIAYGGAVLATIPDDVRRGIHDAFGAVATVLALLLDRDDSQRARQMDLLAEQAGEALLNETKRTYAQASGLDPAMRLPLVDLAIPALRQLTAQQYQDFAETVERLIKADEKVTVFEFALQAILVHRLAPGFGNGGRRGGQRYSYSSMLNELAVLLSALAYVGHEDPAEASRAFETGRARLKNARAQQIPFLPRDACSTRVLGTALEKLVGAVPRLKQQILDACAYCVLADETVTITEAELLRAVAHALDCPLPPFLPGPSP
ncbi:MAG: M48 family metallopeptidase, partial [Phycisphaerae bacterium]